MSYTASLSVSEAFAWRLLEPGARLVFGDVLIGSVARGSGYGNARRSETFDSADGSVVNALKRVLQLCQRYVVPWHLQSGFKTVMLIVLSAPLAERHRKRREMRTNG